MVKIIYLHRKNTICKFILHSVLHYILENIIDNIGIKRLSEIIMNGKINLVTNADLLLSSPKFW